MRLFSKPVSLTHTSSNTVDSSGRPSKVTTTSTVMCAYRHRLASDAFDGGVVVTDEITFYMPPQTAVQPSDTLLMGGSKYEVVSDPFPVWNHRSGVIHHLEVRGRMVNR